MSSQKLTDRRIKNLSAPTKTTEYYDHYVSGLVLRITKTGYKSFALRYRFGKSKQITIGKYGEWSLADARDKARELKRMVGDGVDPLEEKKKRKRKPDLKTFAELANEFKSDHLTQRKQSTQKEYNRIINNELLPKLKKLPVPEITSHDIRKILKAKKKSGSPTMANRIRAVASSIFSYAITEGMAKNNPVEGTAKYESGDNSRDRYYNESEIKALWGAFEQESEPVQSILKLLLITAQRKTETMQIKWDDIDNNIWHIPAENAKNKKGHDVPLSDYAIQIINGIKPICGNSDYVFESPRLDNQPIKWIKQAVNRIREASGVADFRIHDLRRTAATFMAKGGTDPMIIGKVLNHKGLAKENTITAIYNQHDYMDKKRMALNRWAAELERMVTGRSAKIHNL